MKTSGSETVELGQLIVCAFDSAANYTDDPKEVSRLATQALEHIFLHARLRKALSKPRALALRPGRRSRAIGEH
jgi:hypothetical protein